MADSNSKTTVTLEVNGQQASQTLDGLKRIAIEVRKEMDKAAAAGDRVSLKKLDKELRKTERSIRDMESTSAHMEKVLANLGKATPNELQKALTLLKKQLNYIERGTKEWDAQIAKIKSVQNEMNVMNSSMKASIPISQRILSVFNDWAGAAAAAVLSIGGVVAAGKSAVEQYASMQQEETNVRKYTGMTEEQVNRLNDAFKKMDTRTSREQLNKLAQEAGRLGMQSEEDVLGFVRAADKINVALDELGDGATLELSKLTDIFGAKEAYGVEQSLLKVGSVINELSQNSTASASYLEEFAKRMAGVGKVANMTIPDIMGFAAVLDSNGQALEMSASSLSKLVIDMFKESGKIARATGLDVKQFSDLAKKDANEALLTLLQRLKDLGGIDTLAPMFKDMGENGVRMSGVLAALVANIDQVRAQQEAANKAFQEGTSINNEFDVQNTTVQAGLEKARKQFTEIAVALGEKLLPVMSHFISGSSATLRVLSKLVNFVLEYKTAIASAAAAIAAYTVAVNAKTAATKAYEVVVKAAKTAQDGLNAAMKNNLFGIIAAGVAAAVVAIKGYVDKLKDAKKAADVLGNIQRNANEVIADEKSKIESLLAVIRNHNVSMDRRLEAYKKLKQIVPGYNVEMNKEGKILKENTVAIEEYCRGLEKKARYEAAYSMMVEKQGALTKAQMEQDDANIAMEAALSKYYSIPEKRDAAGNKQWDPKKDAAWIEYVAAKNAADAAAKKVREVQASVKRINKVLGEYANDESGSSSKDSASSTNQENTSIKTTTPGNDDVLAGVKIHRAQLENELLQSYARQEITKKQYEDRMLEIEQQYYEEALRLAEGDDKMKRKMMDKLETLRAEKLKVERKLIERKAKEELEAEKNRIDLLKIEREREYNEGKLTEEEYNKAIFDLDIEYLDKRLEYETQFGNAESVEADRRIKKARFEADQRKKALADEKKQREEIRRIMNETFGTATNEDNKEYEEQVNNLNIVREQMLAAAGNDEKKRADIIAATELAILELKKKYYQITEKEYQKMLNKQKKDHKKFVRWLESEEGQAVMGSANTIIDGMTSIFSELQNLIEIQVEAQTTEVESKYDALLSHAEGNKYLEVQLEKQKEEEIAAIKNEANQKMYTMQIMTAVAQGAMAAINAYSSAAAIPLVGYILGPIAAAAALTATGIQIASIKAQKEASAASGYAEGGFTRPGDKYEVAGVVHAGEWVASQELVNSPVARPLLNTLDRAQRTNTIASLRSSDVSGSITAPARLSHAISRSNTRSSDLSSVINALTQRLNEPFVTVNTITGNHGIEKAYKDYERLMKNK